MTIQLTPNVKTIEHLKNWCCGILFITVFVDVFLITTCKEASLADDFKTTAQLLGMIIALAFLQFVCIWGLHFMNKKDQPGNLIMMSKTWVVGTSVFFLLFGLACVYGAIMATNKIDTAFCALFSMVMLMVGVLSSYDLVRRMFGQK